MERLSVISSSMSSKNSPKFVSDALTYLDGDKFFSDEINKERRELRAALEKEIKPQIPALLEKAEFIDSLLPALRKLDLPKKYLEAPYGVGKCPRRLASIVLELARIDGSLVTAFLVHSVLFMSTIAEFGSEEQKKAVLPGASRFELMGGFGLTEPSVGSDASGLNTSAQEMPDGSWVLNGEKKWIGMANKDFLICFARNKATKQVNAFLVDLKLPGVSRSVIWGKMSMRSVHNMHIILKDVRVPASARLPKVNDFTDVAKMLAHSRMFVSWVAVGIGLGLYDNLVAYVTQRQQFNQPIAKFQLVQARVVEVMGSVQAALAFATRLTEMMEKGQASIGRLALGKAWISKEIRKAAALARETLGGNGILIENRIIQAMMDMEAVYTYEGTYDVNTLVAGRELTGLAAFK